MTALHEETPDLNYLPVPGVSEVLIHLDQVPYVSPELANNRFGKVYVAAATMKAKRQEALQDAVEAQPGWEHAAISRDAARKLGRTTVYKALPAPRNDTRTERGF